MALVTELDLSTFIINSPVLAFSDDEDDLVDDEDDLDGDDEDEENFDGFEIAGDDDSLDSEKDA